MAKEVQEYARAPDAYLSELVDTSRFTAAAKASGYEKLEVYLTDSLKAAASSAAMLEAALASAV